MSATQVDPTGPRTGRLVIALVLATAIAAAAMGLPPSPATAVQNGPDPTEESLGADGPYPTTSAPVPRDVSGFGGGVIHHPVADGETFGAVVIAPGFLGSSANYTWMGPRLASHGFVVLLMDTLTRTDLPASRGQQLIAALDHLVDDSSITHLVDGDRLAVAGHSMGGGGALEAASARPHLRAAMAFQPWHTIDDWSSVEVPTMVIGAEADVIAPVADHAIPFYESLASAPERAYLELADAPHSASTTGHAVQERYMVSWLKRFVDDDTRYERFLCPNPGPGNGIRDYRDSCPTGAPADLASMSGKVSGPDGEVVEGVRVMAYASSDVWLGSASATTGADGNYTIHAPAGTYRVRFVPPPGSGLAAEWHHDQPTRTTAQPIDAQPGTSIDGIDADLARTTNLTGTVTDQAGEPLAGATVSLYRDADSWLGTVSATTDADGAYTIHAPAGTYRARFVPPPGSGLVPEWHDDQPTRGTAHTLTVDTDGPGPEVDAQLGTEPPKPSPLYAASWSAVHADAANSDYSPVEPATDVSLLWTLSIQGSLMIGPLPWTINLGPTSDPEGNLYVTSTEIGCHLQALEGDTGRRRWCGEDMDLFTVVSSPLIDRSGNLYVADGTGMHAFTSEGTRIWHTPLEGVPLSAQFTPDGNIVFVTHTGSLHVLHRTTGRDLIDPIDLAPDVTWSPGEGMFACARGTEACPSANTIAVDQDTGVIYFTFWEPGAESADVRAMRYRGGLLPAVVPLWSNDALPGGSASSPAISFDGTRVYVTDNVDGLHALDATTGEVIWSYTIGYAPGGTPSISPGGLIIPAGGATSPLIAIRDEGNEAVLAWQRPDLVNRGIATQTAGDKVYATIFSGTLGCDLVVLDSDDGAVLDREPLPGTCVFSVGTTVGNDGTVYVPTIVGGLHAFK